MIKELIKKKNKSMNLSKSLYAKGIQCQKTLWLKKYNKEVLTPPDETALARFETGNKVGDLACELFPNGLEVEYTRNFDEMIKQTTKYIKVPETVYLIIKDIAKCNFFK